MMSGMVCDPQEQRLSWPQTKAGRFRHLCAMLLRACLLLTMTACACGIGECRDDSEISADVRARLGQSSEFGSNEISVQTIHGVVYLRGLVSTPYQISIAGAIAAAAPRVTSVQNLVAVENAR